MMHRDHKTECAGGHNHGNSLTNKSRLVIVIFFNCIITLSEYIGGIMSGSLALISDAGHNLSDVLSLMLGYAGEKITDKDPSKKFSFGLKRFEVLIALINALSLVAIGIFIVHEAVSRFYNPVEINVKVMLPVAFIGLAGNVLSIVIISRNRSSNLNMKAAFLHLLYDAISSVGVIIAGIIIYFTGAAWMDLAFSIIIVFMILWSSKDIVMESLRIFLQGTPLHIDTDVIFRKIIEIENIEDIHGLHIWSINSKEVFLSCHIIIKETGERVDTNSLIKEVNTMLDHEFGINHTTLQIEDRNLCDSEKGICCR